MILIDLRINILDGVQDNVTPICEISHLVDSKQQSGSPKQQVVTPIQQSGTPNQQMVTPLQQNGTSRIYKMGCANCITQTFKNPLNLGNINKLSQMLVNIDKRDHFAKFILKFVAN